MAISIQEKLFDTDTPSVIDREERTDVDRLRMVYGELGFIPHSRGELNYATLALDNQDRSGGFARLLNETLRHQQKSVSNDETAALRSIIHKIKDYAKSTVGDRAMLLEVDEELDDFRGVQNFLELDKVPNLDRWEDQETTKRGLGLISRHIVVNEALRDSEMPPLDHVADTEAVRDVIGRTRVYEASSAIQLINGEIDARDAFWKKCLLEATRHGAVRAVAFGALRQLGVPEASI